MSLKMDRREMIKLLHDLDNELKSSLEIEICGSSCAILNYGLERTSTDIDVMRSSMPFDQKELNKAINTVALRNGSEDLWINDKSKEVFKYIPADFEPDTEPVRGESFKLLKPKIISKADFVITKLARYERIRQWDISDLKALRLSETDLRALYRKLDAISMKQQYDMLMVEGNFKAIRSDLVKDENGYSYSNSKRITEYEFKRFGIKASEENVFTWQESLNNLTTKAGAIIARIDLNAAEIMKAGNGSIAEFDKKFRISREKNLVHGLDL